MSVYKRITHEVSVVGVNLGRIYMETDVQYNDRTTQVDALQPRLDEFNRMMAVHRQEHVVPTQQHHRPKSRSMTSKKTSKPNGKESKPSKPRAKVYRHCEDCWFAILRNNWARHVLAYNRYGRPMGRPVTSCIQGTKPTASVRSSISTSAMKFAAEACVNRIYKLACAGMSFHALYGIVKRDILMLPTAARHSDIIATRKVIRRMRGEL